MTFVIQLKNKTLICLDCGEIIENTANSEMKDYNCFGYSHSCKVNQKVRTEIRYILGKEKCQIKQEK